MKVRDYTFLGTTQSLCPECLDLVPAKIISRRGRVYFRKRCSVHGEREDFVCSDVNLYDQTEYIVPSRMPEQFGVEPDKGCPFDCGLCTEHEQHTCIGLVELTSSCNLTCPMCYASSAPGGKHASVEECCRAIDRLVEVEGRAEIMQLSGGEPTIHPQFTEILDYAMQQPIDYVHINTNGIRLAHDADLIQTVSQYRDRLEIYLQFDGLSDDVYQKLRGEPLLDIKLRAIERLGEANVHATLAATLQGGVNDDQFGPIVEFAVERPWITGINFQPATYSGRHVLPEELERRITFPDVIHGIERQTSGMFTQSDFMPLPCAHPNCHSIAYAYRSGGRVTPLTRFIDARKNMDLLANGISFTRSGARDAILQMLGREGCCGGDCHGDGNGESAQDSLLPLLELGNRFDGDNGQLGDVASEFMQKLLLEQIGGEEVFRITITSFLDAYNFDVRRLMKCCTHHVLPSGHVIPFCAYNVLYREGHVPLPELVKSHQGNALDVVRSS